MLTTPVRDWTYLRGPAAVGLHDLLRADARRRGWAWFQGPYDLNVWGFRTQGAIGTWDDALGVFWTDVEQRRCAFVTRGTTDPGREGTALRRDGVAVMPTGQHRALWRAGVHRRGTPSEHRALVQARPLKVGRDTHVDGVAIGAGTSDAAGINLHRPYRDGLVRVGDASHGCAVTHSIAAHNEIMALYDQQVLHGHGELVSYTLTDDPELVSAVLRTLESAA